MGAPPWCRCMANTTYWCPVCLVESRRSTAGRAGVPQGGAGVPHPIPPAAGLSPLPPSSSTAHPAARSTHARPPGSPNTHARPPCPPGSPEHSRPPFPPTRQPGAHMPALPAHPATRNTQARPPGSPEHPRPPSPPTRQPGAPTPSHSQEIEVIAILWRAGRPSPGAGDVGKNNDNKTCSQRLREKRKYIR